MCIEPLACYCCSSWSFVFSPFQVSRGGVHWSCISHVACCLALISQPHTHLSAAPTTAVPILKDSSSVCSLVLSALLLPATFLPLFPQLLLFFSLLFCSFSRPACYLLLYLVDFIFSSVEPWLCAVLLFFVLLSSLHPLPHVLVYLLSTPSWSHSPFFHPFLVCIPWVTRSLNVFLFSVIFSFS